MWLVVGASGFFGSYFCKQLLENHAEEIIGTYCSTKPELKNEKLQWESLNLIKPEEIESLRVKISATKKENLKVIILSAIHHPDRVRENFNESTKVNYIGLTALLNILPSNAAVWYVSSDVVYGESKRKHFFKETDTTAPVNAYGRQKTVCEQIVLSYGHNVARCSFLIGKTLTAKPHFYDVILDSLKNGKALEMIIDQYRSAIDFNQAASLIIDLALKFGRDPVGIVNVGSDHPLSKFEVAKEIAKKHDLEWSSLIPITFGSSNFFAETRAKDILLDNGKLKALLNLKEIICNF